MLLPSFVTILLLLSLLFFSLPRSGSASSVPSSSFTVIPVTDPHFVFSLYNWDVSSATGTARTSNPGAWFQVSVTLTTTLGVKFNTSRTAFTDTTPSCVSVATTLDDGPWLYTLLPPGNSSYILTLSTTLDPSVVHTVRLYLHASCEQNDRWLFTETNSFLVVNGLALDSSGFTVPLAVLPLPYKIMVYGDSISEGTNSQNYDYVNSRCGGTTGLRVSSSVDSWAYSYCSGMLADCSLVAFAAQGYCTINSYNYGNVPPLYTLGNDEASAWNKLFANTSRIPSLLANVPTVITNALGFNDQNNDVNPTTLTATITAWINSTRTLFRSTRNTNENSSSLPIITVLTPFGGEMRTNNVTRNAIIAGYMNYRQAVPDDNCTLLIDLYPYAKLGLQGLGQPTAESCDGTHPLARSAAYIGAMVGSYTKQAILQSDCAYKL